VLLLVACCLFLSTLSVPVPANKSTALGFQGFGHGPFAFAARWAGRLVERSIPVWVLGFIRSESRGRMSSWMSPMGQDAMARSKRNVASRPLYLLVLIQFFSNRNDGKVSKRVNRQQITLVSSKLREVKLPSKHEPLAGQRGRGSHSCRPIVSNKQGKKLRRHKTRPGHRNCAEGKDQNRARGRLN
jgi:hypothetical protein